MRVDNLREKYEYKIHNEGTLHLEYFRKELQFLRDNFCCKTTAKKTILLIFLIIAVIVVTKYNGCKIFF